MGCNCKNNEREIQQGRDLLKEFRELFIKRMTIDNGTDKREKDYNQSIFFLSETTGEHEQCFYDTTMEMVLDKFDLAVKDWRKTFCDTDNCKRK